MAKVVTKYSIFIGSPSDLSDERLAVEEVIDELNISYGANKNIVLELLKWETHSAPGISDESVQDLVNDDIGDNYDVFIGLLWLKFGTPTSKYGSGTEEEFERVLKRYNENNKSVQILFYFKESLPVALKEIDPIELSKVREFQKKLEEKNVLYGSFDSCETLKSRLRLSIPKRINQLIETSENGNSEFKEADIVKSAEDNVPEIHEELGLIDYAEMFESLMSESTISINRIADATHWIGGEMSKKADEINRTSQIPNPNNHNILKSIYKRTAKIMNDYSDRIELDIPIFYTSFIDAVDSGSKMLNVVEDFNSEKTITDLEEAKEAMMTLRIAITDSHQSMTEYYNAVKDMPRIQREINVAKSRLLRLLSDLLEKMNNTLQITEEFSDDIGSKIDSLKLTQDI